MTEIFLYIVNMSITATILAVVVLLLRLLLKKAPKWVSVLLWGLVALRLICPFAVESPFSLMPKTDWVVQEPLTEEDFFLDSVPDTIPAFDSSSFGSDVTVQYSYYPLEKSDIEIHRGISISFILSCIWAAGMAALLLHTVISTIRLHRSIGAAVRVRDNVWESSAVESPFVLGMIRPRIYVPRGMSEEKLAYVIAHEKAHIRRKDHWWKPLGFLLLTIHWFNPVLWLAYILLCRDIEMACDERVIKEYDDVQRADYSEALLDCSVKRKMISACPLAFGEVSVKERIKSVLHYKKPAFWIVVLAVIACVVTAVCFLTNPMEKLAISIDDHDWYFERAYITDLEKNIIEEEYQLGLQPKMENAEPVNAILVPGDEPMRYKYIEGDWDTDRIELLFIPEKTDSRTARYTVELYRDTGELYQGADAVMEPMTDGDRYVLTVYYTADGSEIQLIFTTEKMPGTVDGKKKLTLEEVLTLSEKQMALTWEDFADYVYTDVGTWNFRCIYEIDEVFWLEITGGSMHGTPMQINLCADASYGDGADYVDIRRTYADEDVVSEFIERHEKSQLFGMLQEWFYETAWEIAEGTAEENGITLKDNEKYTLASDEGDYLHIEFPEADGNRYVRVIFIKDETGKYTISSEIVTVDRTHVNPDYNAVIKKFDTSAFENGMMALNIVEFITHDDTERIAELELSEQDMIAGYYIHDEEESITTLKLPEDTEFFFFDWSDAYTDETDERYEILGERWISTRDAELFYEYWLPYADSPGYPFAFYVEEGKVVIKEIPLM